MRNTVTRREFLKIAGAGTAGVGLLGTSAAVGSRYESYLPKGGPKMNVVVVNLDSLRRDHVGIYGNDWIETPNLDALAQESLRFTRPYPESIPTICARRTLTDKWFGNFMNKMADLDLTGNTLLIVFSDHGVSMGEHGYTGKVARAIWPELTDIIFYVRYPEGKGAGETRDFYASIHDIAPTILGQMGMELPEPMDGQNLSPIFEGAKPERERPYFTLGYDNYSWAQDERYAMSVRNDGEEARLYDVFEDPKMNRNIAGDRPDVVMRMFDEYILKDAGGEPLPMY